MKEQESQPVNYTDITGKLGLLQKGIITTNLKLITGSSDTAVLLLLSGGELKAYQLTAQGILSVMETMINQK